MVPFRLQGEQHMNSFSATSLIAIILTAIGIGRASAQLQFEEAVIDSPLLQTMSVWPFDMDGDRDTDLVACAFQTNLVVWLEQDEACHFTRHVVSDTFGGPRTVFAIDLDRDGDADILGAGFSSSKIAWWENDGSQNFTMHTLTDSFGGAHTVYAEDLDGDLDLDVYASSWGTDGIRWWENDGVQHFTEHIIDSGGDRYPCAHAADLDNDGDIDMAGCIWGTNEVLWWENDGSQNFTEHSLSSTFGYAHWVHPVDLDLDGDVDILAAAYGGDEVAWWRNDGSGTFTKRSMTTAFNGATSITSADLDADGDIDVISAAEEADQIRWFENDGEQRFTSHIITSNFNGASYGHPTDLDGDGDIDIVGAAHFGHKISWFRSVADYGVSVTPAEETICQGYTGTFKITVDYHYGIHHPVHLSAAVSPPPPTGTIDLSFSSNPLTPADSCELLIVVSDTTTIGSYVISLTAASSEDTVSTDSAATVQVCRGDTTVMIEYDAPGWQLLSVPLKLAAPAFSDIFIYRHGYLEHDTVKAGYGYWEKLGVVEKEWTGLLMETDTIPVEPRWNIVGSITRPVAVGSIGSIPPGLVTGEFYGHREGEYYAADTIRPGHGYWVKAMEGGSLVYGGEDGETMAGVQGIRIVRDGEMPPSPPGEGVVEGKSGAVPHGVVLRQNYPNPFNPQTVIWYGVPEGGMVSLKVYDILGREVGVLVDRYVEAGEYGVEWNAGELPDGVYMCKLTVSGGSAVGKLILLR